MSVFLGLDTSNYTTSVAVYDTGAGVQQYKRLLPVAPGERGLRQSDAVFHHTRQLPELVEQALTHLSAPLTAIGVSVRPTQEEKSYMPCFLAGQGVARALSAALGVPAFPFSHQQGHVAAALFDSGASSLRTAPFLAFHVSGGTTQALLAEPEGPVFRCTPVASSADLKAGQLIDRVGVRMGLSFPAGPALEKLAAAADREIPVRPSMDGNNCHLSGAENQCVRLLEEGEKPANVALFCLRCVQAALDGMTRAVLRQTGPLPVVYAGGVMSNRILRDRKTIRRPFCVSRFFFG